MPQTLTSSSKSSVSAQGRLRHALEQCEELRTSCRDFISQLENSLVDSSPGSVAAPAYSSSDWDSQSTPLK